MSMTRTRAQEERAMPKMPSATHCAEIRGASLLERLRRRQAERQAAADVEAARLAVQPAIVSRRFAQIAGPIAEAGGCWSHTTGIALNCEATPGSLRMTTFGGAAGASLVLILQPGDGAVLVTIRGSGRGDQRVVALDAEDFEPEPLARSIVEEFFAHAEAIMALEMLKEEVSR